MGVLRWVKEKIFGLGMSYEEKQIYREAFNEEYKQQSAAQIKKKAVRDAKKKAEKKWRED